MRYAPVRIVLGLQRVHTAMLKWLRVCMSCTVCMHAVCQASDSLQRNVSWHTGPNYGIVVRTRYGYAYGKRQWHAHSTKKRKPYVRRTGVLRTLNGNFFGAYCILYMYVHIDRSENIGPPSGQPTYKIYLAGFGPMAGCYFNP